MQQIENILDRLDNGTTTVCYKDQNGQWGVNEEAKLAILEYFKIKNSSRFYGDNAYDKIPLKFTDWSNEDFAKALIRVVPGAIVRYGAYIGPHSVIMPSFINIGSHIGEGTMIDSWATVGSCAFIGKRCHISSSSVIGGVLEPISARPVIIEDESFIGANSSITEGTIIGQGAVIAGGVTITSSTKIYDRITDSVYLGYIPPYSVAVPGIIMRDEVRDFKSADAMGLNPKKYQYATSGVIIVKTVDAKTREKVSINEILRTV